MADEPQQSDTIESLLAEGRTYPPPAAFTADALVADTGVYAEADADSEAFWAEQAGELLDWFEPWHTVLEWDLPFAKWFVGGKLNASYNCLDRHVDAGRGDQVAYHWEGEPGDTRTITYAELLHDVSQLANALKALGVEKGDRVNIYLGMVPELPMALLACAAHRGGALGRVRRLLVRLAARPHPGRRGQGAHHRRRRVAARPASSRSRRPPTPRSPSARRSRRCWCCERTEQDVAMTDGRDVWWHDLVPQQSADCPPEPMDAEDLLYLLYTSGTTARPKGIMHTTGGYLTQVAWTHKYVFDLQADTDVYWCAADVGWVTGHSYIVYGPLMNGATSVLYEGTPDHPGQGPALADRRAVRRHHPLHRAHRDPHVHEVGPRVPGGPRPLDRCGCSAASASPSTPRRGSGTGSTSAASVARSSTRGGRPRPAPS